MKRGVGTGCPLPAQCCRTVPAAVKTVPANVGERHAAPGAAPAARIGRRQNGTHRLRLQRRSLRSRWRLCRLTDAASPLRGVSAFGSCKFPRSNADRVMPPNLSLRGGRRPTWQSREDTADSYRASIITHKPIASVAALTAQPLAALPPYGCGVPFTVGERLSQLQISAQ